MAEITPREKEIEDLKAEVGRLNTSLTSCSEGERIAIRQQIAGTRQEIAATQAELTRLKGQAAGGGEPLDLPLVDFLYLKEKFL
jgi:hypothetical protein